MFRPAMWCDGSVQAPHPSCICVCVDGIATQICCSCWECHFASSHTLVLLFFFSLSAPSAVAVTVAAMAVCHPLMGEVLLMIRSMGACVVGRMPHTDLDFHIRSLLFIVIHFLNTFFFVSLSFFPFCSSSQCCRMSHVLIYNLVAIHVVTFHPHRASTTHTETQASGVFHFACAVCICIIPLLTLCIRSWCTSCATAFYSFYTPPLIPWSFEQKFMSCLFYL